MVLGGLGTLKEKPKSKEDLLTPETAQKARTPRTRTQGTGGV